tara:strand:- start:9549 stop:12593 length:3045 start_codon:yes stop_codon:yes gene_type:complete
MTAVSQKIPNLIGGISQQPIEKQLPGTVKDAVNVVPDVKGILAKRPGSQLVATLSVDVDGVWHNYYRDDAEQYFIRVRPDGQVDVWDARDGSPRIVRYTTTPLNVPENGKDPTPGAKPITDSCDVAAYQTAYDDLADSIKNLRDANEEIQEITVKLERDDSLTDAERATLESDKATLEASIPGLLTAYSTAQAAFEVAATPCGVFPNPYSLATPTSGTNALPYFKKATGISDEDYNAQFQMVTINDFTFVANRSITTAMTSTTSPPKVENASFVVVEAVQYTRTYNVTVVLEDSTKYECDAGPYATDTSLDATLILNDLADDIAAKVPNTPRPEIIGNGLFVTRLYDTTIDNPGTGYSAGTNVDTTGGTGTGLKVNTTVLSDVIQTVSISDFGSGYTDGDVLTVTGGNDNCTFTINSGGNFTVETTDPELITPINSEVNNVSLLPSQCKDGYVAKVVNTFEDEDDYYVQFFTEGSVNSGSGVWEETVAPGIEIEIDPTTMPHIIRRLSDGTFEVSPIEWIEREVGDNITNPLPTIIGQKITKAIFFRNRMVFLAGENVVFSVANEYYNLFAITAKTISDADPIDLLVSSTYPSVLYDAIATAPGLLLLADNQQFLVVAGSTEIFSPSTAVAKAVGSYKYNTKVRPVNMGQSIGFLNDGGFRSRFFELIPNREFNYEAAETSKPVDQLIPNGINLIADSKDNNMLALAVKHDTAEYEDLTRFVWVYRYFNAGEQRLQSAWFKWKLSGNLLYHAIMDDKYYAVTAVKTGNVAVPEIATLQSFDLKLDSQSILVGLAPTMDQYDYQVHMDNFTMVTTTQMTYDSTNDTTTWRLPIGYHGPEPITVYELELNYPSLDGYITTGRTVDVEGVGVTNGVNVTAPGDWTNSPVLCGYNFDMIVEMPTFFVTKKTGENSFTSDTTGYLTIHRAVIDFDVTGECETTLLRKGRELQIVGYESTIQDGYIADSSAVMQSTQRTISIYDKNTNIDLTLNSKHPTPTNVTSVTWQGEYSQGNYQRI